MDICLLCLQIKQESNEIIKATSVQWQNENIEKLIEKHFWPLKSITTNSWLCKTCWHILHDFHKFYTRIFNAHASIVSMLKVEMVVVMESNEDVDMKKSENKNSDIYKALKEKELPSNNNEGEFSQSTTVKSETANEEEPIPAETELPRRKTRHKTRDPLDKLLPLKYQRVCRTRKSLKKTQKETCEKSIEQPESEIKETVTNESSVPIENSNCPKDFAEDCKSSSDLEYNESDNDETLRVAADWKPITNTYYKPKTKRNALDEFLAQNFNITCALCQAPMQTFHELCKHFVKEHNKRGFVSCCNKKFLRRSVLVDHIHRHLDPEYFKCNKCGKLMSDRRCLEMHIKNHEKPEKTHVCDICGKSFSGLTLLKNHKLIHLSEEEKKFPCEQCGKPFANVHLLSSHVRVVHLNKYALVCDICGAKMRSKDVFERHILKHKGVPIPTIACDICGIKMTNQRGLKHHKTTQHPEGGKKEYPCHLCTKISPTLDAHKRHVQYKHELGYDFKCTMCEKAFKRSCSLKEHMATHTGTVLYTCPYCPRTFNSNANMHSHRKKAHPKEWEEAHRAKYSDNYNLTTNDKTITAANEEQNSDGGSLIKWN